jgi:3-aminobutyryl-CoA ammonia-lyase
MTTSNTTAPDHLALSTKYDGMLRVRLGALDTHYRAHLIPAATILRLFADCSTEVGLRENNGREGLLAAYEGATFLHTCRAGDYVEIRAVVLSRGNRSRRVGLAAFRHVRAPESDGGLSTICNPPELIAHGVLVSVRPKN